MTAREIRQINKEISRLKAKIIRIQAEADNISPKLSDLPSASQTSALNSLSRDDFVENCLFMHLSLHYSWAKILTKIGGSNTIDSLKKMCYRHHW